MACEFLEAFLKDLPRLPPARDGLCHKLGAKNYTNIQGAIPYGAIPNQDLLVKFFTLRIEIMG